MAKMEKTSFLNVDLDIYSKSDLAPLVHALDKKVSVLYLGREKRLFSTHLELSSHRKNADETIRTLVRLVAALASPARKLWDSAIGRTFNIGIQSGEAPDYFQLALSPATLRDVSSVKGHIIITVYGRLKRTALRNRQP
jgi:hypothetical protein